MKKETMAKQKELLVIMPAYNEEKNIPKVIKQLKEHQIDKIADILVIDDASEDSTGQIVKKEPYILIRNICRLGYGNSLRVGYQYAMRRNYRYVIQMDSDGQHDACNIPVIYRRLLERDADGRYPDLVLASRFMEGSSDFSVSILKRAAYAWFRFLVRAISGRKIADPTTGLQGLSRKAFCYYSDFRHYDDKYPDANIILQMLLLDFCVAEIPAVMHARTGGRSMHKGAAVFWYMCRMFFEIPAVVFRIKVLKKDAKAGLGNVDQE